MGEILNFLPNAVLPLPGSKKSKEQLAGYIFRNFVSCFNMLKNLQKEE